VTTAAPPRSRHARPPFWRDVRVLHVLVQVAFVVALIVAVNYLWGNLQVNARRVGLQLGFDYLDRPFGVDIADSSFRPTQPVRDAILVGYVNTIRVSAVGVAFALLLGVVIGVGRLSTNWLVRKSAAAYVETLRNVPVLVWILFMYLAVLLKFPPIFEAAEYLDAVVFSNRGLNVPWFDAVAGGRAFLAVLAAALIAAVALGVLRTRRSDETGVPHHRIAYGLALFVAITAIGYAALSAPVTLTLPEREGRVVTGGINLGAEFSAVLFALVLYHASHIAEIVRGSIQAVPKGQFEAANAIALSGFQRLRYVILPQAFRIAVPPVASQFLSLTKNSSLATFVGFVELTRLTQQAIANGNPAPPSYLVLMVAYLSLSLTISLFANLVNRRLALETR
jgi:general L-amino acid transport system permease protein